MIEAEVKEMLAFKEKCQEHQGVEIKVELSRGVQCVALFSLCIAESGAK